MSGTLTPYASNVRWGPPEKTRIVIEGRVFGPAASGSGPVRAPERGMCHVPRATWSIWSGGSWRFAQCAGSVAGSGRRWSSSSGDTAGIRLPRVAESTFIAAERTSGVSSVPSRHRPPLRCRSRTDNRLTRETTGRTWSHRAGVGRDPEPGPNPGPGPGPGTIEKLLSELPDTPPRQCGRALRNPGRFGRDETSTGPVRSPRPPLARTLSTSCG